MEGNRNMDEVTAGELLNNIFGCISANVPDQFVWVVNEQYRSIDASGHQTVSGRYYYSVKEDMSQLTEVEPGELAYPINLTHRLFDTFYADLTKNWSKARICFKHDGQCNIEVLERLS